MKMNATLQARDVSITQTCDTAKEFVDRFYKRLDEERHTIKNMYEETGKLIFNGNAFEGPESIGKFYESLPKSFNRISGFDAHEIDAKDIGGTPAIMISVGGNVCYGKKAEMRSYDDRVNDPKVFPFFQTFLVTSKSGTWKIQADNFRFQNSNTDAMLKMDLWNVSMMETA